MSALLSTMQTLVLLVLSILLLPMAFEVDGVWLAVPVIEVLGLVLTAYYLYKKRRIYHYY